MSGGPEANGFPPWRQSFGPCSTAGRRAAVGGAWRVVRPWTRMRNSGCGSNGGRGGGLQRRSSCPVRLRRFERGRRDRAQGRVGHGRRPAGGPRRPSTSSAFPTSGDQLQSKIPQNAGRSSRSTATGKNSADSTVVLYTKSGATWDKTRSWPAHNGKKGWTADHHEGDKRSPVGVFTLTDAGGVLADPGAKLPYTQAASFQAPHYWAKSHSARLRLRHRHRLQPRQGHRAERPDPARGAVQGRQHLAPHGPRQRHIGMREPVEVRHGVPAAHDRPQAAPGRGHGRQGVTEELEAVELWSSATRSEEPKS